MNAVNGALLKNTAKDISSAPAMVQWLSDFVDLYQQLDSTQLHRLSDVYDNDIIFEDPLHHVEGLPALTQYFTHMYAHVTSCRFEISNHFCANDQSQQAALYWTMHLQHTKLNKGRTITVKGHSLLVCRQNKIVYHRDYFDLGNMLYEQLPLLGGIVRKIKQQAAKV